MLKYDCGSLTSITNSYFICIYVYMYICWYDQVFIIAATNDALEQADKLKKSLKGDNAGLMGL